MKHSGRALKAAMKLIVLSLVGLAGILALGVFAVFFGKVIVALAPLLIALWILFVVFTLYFFRDPEPQMPEGANMVLSPAHGKVDVIGTTTEPLFMGGDCQRISIFLSVIDVHVQRSPVAAKIAFSKHTTGQFMSALKSDSAEHNENVLLGLTTNTATPQKIGVRLIAGVLARRIIPFVEQGEEIERGQRISLIQFGSRADVYLPRDASIKVRLGDHVVGGETILAELK